MFTLVQHVPVESFKGLQTENVRPVSRSSQLQVPVHGRTVRIEWDRDDANLMVMMMMMTIALYSAGNTWKCCRAVIIFPQVLWYQPYTIIHHECQFIVLFGLQTFW